MAIHHSVQEYDYLVRCEQESKSELECFTINEQYPVNQGYIYDDNGRCHLIFASKDAVFTNFATFSY